MNQALIIYKKELREMFRDKRVRTTAFVTPALMIIMFVFLFGFVFGTIEKTAVTKIFLVGDAASTPAFLNSKDVKVSTVPTVQAGEKLIKDGAAKLVLDIQPQANGQERMDAYFDPKEDMSKLALGSIREAISQFNKGKLDEVLKDNHIPKTQVEPITVAEKPVQVGGKEGASGFILSLLPYLIVIWAFYGGMGIASDLVAGEKEKNTLETLLITPVSRIQIAMGKFLALGTICLASSLSSFVGLAVVSTVRSEGVKKMLPHGLGVSFVDFLMILGLLVPLVVLFAGIMLAVSTNGRNIREAQSKLASLSFLVIMPAVFSQFIGYTDFAKAQWVNLVPVLNAASCLRSILLNNPNFTGIAITIGVNAALGIAALLFSTEMFKRESVLLRV